MQINASSPSVCPALRTSRSSSLWKVRARASAAATAAATPSLISRVMRMIFDSSTSLAYRVQQFWHPAFYNRTMAIASVRKVADADFPTRWGHFRILGFEGVYAPVAVGEGCNPAPEKEEAVALVMGDLQAAPPLV